jgi:hypothetical protein
VSRLCDLLCVVDAQRGDAQIRARRAATAHFAPTVFKRYLASSKDLIYAKHSQISVQHHFPLNGLVGRVVV